MVLFRIYALQRAQGHGRVCVFIYIYIYLYLFFICVYSARRTKSFYYVSGEKMKAVGGSATPLVQRLTVKNLKNSPWHGKRDPEQAEKVAYNRHYVREWATAAPLVTIQDDETGDFTKAAGVLN